MKTTCFFAILLVASVASVKASELDDIDMLAELQALAGADIVPRLLQQIGLGDAAAPGAYGSAPAATSATPGSYASQATLQEDSPNTAAAAATPVTPSETPSETPETPSEVPETPSAVPGTPADTTTTATEIVQQPTPATSAPTSGTCPAGSKKTGYQAGILYCVMTSPTADVGEVYVAMDGQDGSKVAVATQNQCYPAPCVETMDVLETTTTTTTNVGGVGNRKLRVMQGTEVTPFVMQVEESSTAPAKLSHSKCFFVCESDSPETITVVRPKDASSN